MVNATSTIYDLTNSTASDNLFEFINVVNDLTGQSFMMGVVIVSFIVFFVSFKQFGNQEALFASGFMHTVIILMMTAFGWIPLWFTLITVGPFALFFAYMMTRSN